MQSQITRMRQALTSNFHSFPDSHHHQEIVTNITWRIQILGEVLINSVLDLPELTEYSLSVAVIVAVSACPTLNFANNYRVIFAGLTK
jgi:hypothetical protein